MTEEERFTVFKAQTKNVRKLAQVRKQLVRTINSALIRNSTTSVEIHTKCLALVFCAWVEASFSKLIHTPYGFTLDEIQQIKTEQGRVRAVEDAWNKAIQLGLARVATGPGYRQNRRQEIERLVREHVANPSLIRNKVAHGQWEIALNRDNTAKNNELTNQIEQLNVVQLERWFETQSHLSLVVESLIESPGRTFQRDYWVHVTNLKDFLDRTSHWTMSTKQRMLKDKQSRRTRNFIWDIKNPTKNGYVACLVITPILDDKTADTSAKMERNVGRSIALQIAEEMLAKCEVADKILAEVTKLREEAARQ